MRKILSMILALVLITTCGISLAEETAAARTQFWIPANLAEIEVDELPVSEFPKMKTKTAHGIINVTVDPMPDALYANWMGYGEEPEEVQLKDGVGVVYQRGHKYQLGAGYVNYSWREYVGGVDYMDDEYVSSYKEAEAYLRENYAEEIAAGAKIENEPFKGYYVYYTHDVCYIDENDDVQQIGDYVWKQVSDYYPTLEEAEAAAEKLGGMKSGADYSDEYKTTVYSVDGYNTVRDGGYAYVYNVRYGYSDGSPNRAYSLVTGEYVVDYTRAGVPNYASRTIQGKDFFETGIEGAVSTVRWEIGKKANHILSIKTVYPEGSDIASISVSFTRGNIYYHYTVTYNAGEGEQYVVTYSAKDQMIKAYYLKDGRTVAANSSATKWINRDTHQVEYSLEPLDGELIGHPAHLTAK